MCFQSPKFQCNDHNTRISFLEDWPFHDDAASRANNGVAPPPQCTCARPTVRRIPDPTTIIGHCLVILWRYFVFLFLLCICICICVLYLQCTASHTWPKKLIGHCLHQVKHYHLEVTTTDQQKIRMIVSHPAAEMFQVVGPSLSTSVLGWEDKLVASIAPELNQNVG